MPPTPGKPAAALIEAYLQHLQDRACSPATRASHGALLRHLVIEGCDLSQPDTARVQQIIFSPELRPATRYAYFTWVWQFYDWMLQQGEIASHPLAALPRPSSPRQHLQPAVPPPSQPSLPLIQEFLAYLESCGRSRNTLRSYRWTLTSWCAHIGDPRAATPDTIARYLCRPNWSPVTRAHCFDQLRHFYHWLKRQGRLLADPILKLDRPKVPKSLPTRVMSAGEAEKFLAVAQADPDQPRLFTYRVMIELLYSCSLRCGELLQLTLEDYDPSLLCLKIRPAKTGRGRLVPVGRAAAALLDRYLREVRPTCKIPYLFPSPRNRKGCYSPSSLMRIVKLLREQSAIRTKASSHSFRKTSATLMLKNGAPLTTIQQLLGHGHISSTEIYTKLTPRDLFKMHAAHHPREKQKNLPLPALELPGLLFQSPNPRTRHNKLKPAPLPPEPEALECS